MDACPFNELHYTRNEDSPSVAYRVDFDLFSSNVFIHEDGFVNVDLNGCFEVFSHVAIFGDDLHRPSAEDKAWPDENGIAYLIRGRDTLFNVRYRSSARLRDFE